MKKTYERASLSVVTLVPKDVITTSPIFGDDSVIILPDDIF